MADTNNFENVQKSFEYITDALDSIRAQNALSSNSNDKVLTNILHELKVLENEDNTELVKVFLAELKRNLEEKHNFVETKFSEIENSFSEIVQKLEGQLQPHEIKELFEIIASNLSNFSKDFISQKKLIEDVSLRVEELIQDETQKNDIFKNISALKIEIEKFSNGFESVILNLNDNFKEVSEILEKIDSTESIKDLKKDIENIFLSANAVLSTLQVIDRKNRELEQIITHVVTKEDFNLEREQVAKLITQNNEITGFMSILPKEKQIDALTEKLDTTVGVVNALKNMINETGKQNQELLTAQLDNLESKILNISTEEEFIGFRKELRDFTTEVIQSTNLMRTDLVDTNSDLKDLLAFLSDMDIKNTFTNFANLSKKSENNIIANIAKFTENISEALDKNRKLINVDFDEETEVINQKIESTKQELVEGSKGNLASILEHIQSVINNIFSVKNSMHVENLENVEIISEKFQDLKDDLTVSNNLIVQNSQESVEFIARNLDKVFEEVINIKENLSEVSSQNSENIKNSFEEIVQNISSIKKELNQNYKQNSANITTTLDHFSEEISALKTSMELSTHEKTAEIKEFVENSFEKLNTLRDALTNNASSNKEDIKLTIEKVAEKFSTIESVLEQGLEANSTDIENSMANLSGKLNELKMILEEGFDKGSANADDLVLLLPEKIKENQLDFENESKFLIEENSKNINEIGEKIQNLIKSLIAKENPFKGEVLFEFSELKSNLQTIKEELLQSNDNTDGKIQEKFDSVVQNIENTIIEYNTKYNIAVNHLQNKIGEYFDLLQQTSEENDLKLDNSIKTSSEIKNEIQTLAKELSVLKNDSAISELSDEVITKFEKISADINQLQVAFSIKNEDLTQNIISISESLDEKFKDVKNIFKTGQTLTVSELSELIEDLGNKAEVIKTQMEFTSTNIINNLFDKNGELAEKLIPISESVNKIAEINFEYIVSDIKDQIEDTHNSLMSLFKEDIQNNNIEQIQIISQNFENLNTKLDETLDKSFVSIMEFKKLKNILEEVTQNIEIKSEEIKNQLNDKEFLTEQFSFIKDSFNELESRNTDLLNNALKVLLNKLTELEPPAFSTEISAAEIKDEIIEKINITENNLLQSSDEFNHFLLTEFQKNIEDLKAEYEDSTKKAVSAIVEQTTQDSREKVFEKLDLLQENFADVQGATKTSILNEIIQSKDELEEAVLTELQENIKVIKEVLKTFSDENLNNEINEKIGDLGTNLDKISKTVEDKLTESEGNYKESARMLLSEVKVHFYEKVDDSLDELKSFMELTQDKNTYIKTIDDLKSDTFARFSELLSTVEDSIKSISVKEDLTDLGKEIKLSVNDLLESFYEKLSGAFEDSKLGSDILDKADEISHLIEELKNNTFENITEKIDNVELNLEQKSKELSDLIGETKVSLDDLKENFIDLSLNSSMEMSGLLVTIQEKIEKIETKINDLDLHKTIETSKDDLIKEFTLINQKLDSVSLEASSDSCIENDVREIKEILSTQKDFVSKLEKLEELEKIDDLPKLNDLTGIKTDIKEALEVFEGKLSNTAEHQTDSINFKEELATVKEELLENLLNIFNEISFIAETEEIKDFIEEKAEEIKGEIKLKRRPISSENPSDLNVDDILSSLDILHEKADNVDGNCSYIVSEIQEVKNHILSGKTGEDTGSEYSYTLQDVESDIAKIRLALKELSQSGGIGDLDKLNEDIMSISTRTNKLLLNSDESYAALNSNLDELRNVVCQFEEKVKYLSDKQSLNELEKKLEDTNNLVLSCVKSDKIFNQTFMYLAEWIDKADENINTIKQNMVKTIDIEKLLDKFSKKFEKQEEKIKSLETKIEKLTKVKSTKETDVKTLVREVLGMVEPIDGNVDLKLTKKVDNIDKQLVKLGKSIEKITSYVD